MFHHPIAGPPYWYDLLKRLINLVVKNNREAQNEPTIDAFKDLACYGIIAQIVKNGKWGK